MFTKFSSLLGVTVLLLAPQAFASDDPPAPRPRAPVRAPVRAPEEQQQQQQQQTTIIIERERSEPRRRDDDCCERPVRRRYNAERDYMCEEDDCQEPRLPYPPQGRMVPVYPPQQGPEYFEQPPPQFYANPGPPVIFAPGPLGPPVWGRPHGWGHPGPVWGGHPGPVWGHPGGGHPGPVWGGHPGPGGGRPGPGWGGHPGHGRRIAIQECRVEEKPVGVFKVLPSDSSEPLFVGHGDEGAANANYMLNYYLKTSMCTGGMMLPQADPDRALDI